MDKTYILAVKRESYGYKCITGEKQFYIENYPGAVIENSSLDELLKMPAAGDFYSPDKLDLSERN